VIKIIKDKKNHAGRLFLVSAVLAIAILAIVLNMQITYAQEKTVILEISSFFSGENDRLQLVNMSLATLIAGGIFAALRRK